MPLTFADMKHEHIGLQENNAELKAENKKLTEKIIDITKLTLPQAFGLPEIDLFFKTMLY